MVNDKTMQAALLLEAQRELARRDYAEYVEYVHNGRYKHGRHTRYLCKRLNELEHQQDQRIVIAMPPRHSKSMTITETYPSYYLLRNPDKRVIISAYGDSLAGTFSRRNREKVENYGRELFDISLSREKATANEWEIAEHAGGLVAAGIGGTITGKGADLLIIDDPIKNMQEAQSETYRERVWQEWEATLATRLHSGANVILIMTMWHQDDIANRLIKDKDWEHIILPARALDNDPMGRVINEPLWADGGFDSEWLKNKEVEVGSRVWASLYQQSPVADGGNIFDIEAIQYYRDTEIPHKQQLQRLTQSWDLAFKGDKTNDYVVGQVWWKDGANSYLIDQVRGQWTFTQTLAQIKKLHRKYPATTTTLVEEKANGAAVIDVLKSQIAGLIPINPTASKESRASAVTPFIEAGNVYLPKEAKFTDGLVTEMAAFPYGKNDDQVDSLTQYLNRAYVKDNKIRMRKGLY